jgi:hypothetical protein
MMFCPIQLENIKHEVSGYLLMLLNTSSAWGIREIKKYIVDCYLTGKRRTVVALASSTRIRVKLEAIVVNGKA